MKAEAKRMLVLRSSEDHRLFGGKLAEAISSYRGIDKYTYNEALDCAKAITVLKRYHEKNGTFGRWGNWVIPPSHSEPTPSAARSVKAALSGKARLTAKQAAELCERQRTPLSWLVPIVRRDHPGQQGIAA
jgi:hypothetical protein